ncbi:hypothetical protein C8J57DRAFT_1710437 [Mycena rebaudengoi]|nr:hypothetical protein C8J57DRAFT_1710437 [Mycena rebaudengoi]
MFGHLNELVEDVLLVILMHCDVADVVAFSQTCRTFHRLAFTKSVWVHFVSDLVRRGIIDGRPDEILSDLPTERLVGLIKKSVCGPQAWSPIPLSQDSTPSAPLTTRRTTLHPDVDLYWQSETQLLPGGNYVLTLQGSGEPILWSVHGDRLAWKHTCSIIGAEVSAFAAQIIRQPDQIVVMTCLRTQEEKKFIEITTIDLRTGTSELIVVVRASDHEHYFSPTICGDIVAVAMTQQNHIFLINWKTAAYVIVPIPRNFHPPQLALTAPYVVLTLGGPPEDDRITVIPIDSLESHWMPVESVSEPVNIIHDDRLLLYCAPLVPGEYEETRLSVHESPIRRGRFKIFLQLKGSDSIVLRIYHLFSHDDRVHLCLRSTTLTRQLEREEIYPIFLSGAASSFSGHTVLHDELGEKPEIYSSVDIASSRRILHLHDEHDPADYVHISAYTGALTYFANSDVVIEYYD